MKRFTVLFISLMLLLFAGTVLADDLNLTFEDDSDVANWSHHDETNFWTGEAHDPTGGVGGSGALKLTDAGYDMLAKRAVTATVGTMFKLQISIKTENWDDQSTYPIYVQVQGIVDVPDTVYVNNSTDFTTYTITGIAQHTDGYIRIKGSNTLLANTVWVDNVVFDDDAPIPPVVINEIYYNPPTIQGDDKDYEFLEFYNPGPADVPLEGYAVTEGIEYTFVAADTIKANGYFVLAYNSANYEGSVQWTSGGLKNSGEDIVLKDPTGMTVDSVDYDDWGSDWPKWADGSGASLSLKDAELDNNDPANWYGSAFGGTPGAANGPRGVMVYFRANTATVPDTLGKNSVVQVRGSSTPLQWGGGSLIFLQNEVITDTTDEWGSSDYWTGKGLFPADMTYYKFYTNASHNTVSPGVEWEHQGWEQNISDTANDRILDLTNFAGEDTALAVQYVNGWADKPGQYAHPWTDNDTSFVVWLRVNVEGFDDFNPEQHVLGVRGSNNSDWGQTGELGWGKTFLLTQENDHANGGSRQYKGKYFYSGAIHVPMKYKDNGISWKFVVHYKDNPLDEDWGNMFWNPNMQEERMFNGSGNDTTFYWRWYDHMKPKQAVNEDVVVVTFKADMTTATNNRGFTPGDTVVVKAGYNKTADDIYTSKPMVKEGLIGAIYSVTDTLTTSIGKDLQYNYYVIKDGIEYREIFYDFTDEEGGTAAEKRKVNMAGSTVTVEDVETDVASLRRQPNFRNLDPVAQDLTVHFEVDLRPAYYTVLAGKTLTDIQGAYHIDNADDVFLYGSCINGPATGGWQTWGAPLEADTTRQMWDDGTHGDMTAGDSIYTRILLFAAGTPKGQEFKFGIRGGDNEGGYGNNHIENLDDSQAETYLRSQFGSIDPLFYDAWDFENGQPATGIAGEGDNLPKVYALHQNYPNPFNPETTIPYALPKAGKVTLTVFNVLGQKVHTLINGVNATAGNHLFKWNGLDDAGNRVASGVYFYKLEAGNFVSVKKMILMK